MSSFANTFDIYRDISERTDGAIYLGVVGPVRTGKSTFIKRFMDVLVLPNMANPHMREQANDELPQSGNGKTIMTTEPKFIPMEPAEIALEDGSSFQVRLIDCVGYMTEGALGHMEDSAQRMVKTPWSSEEIPFLEAAEIGTRKVIEEHSTIGIVVTTDGSFGEIPRDNYIAPEQQTIAELKRIGKPYIVLLNSSRPYARETKELAQELEAAYQTSVYPVNCQQLKPEDITKMMELILASFPIRRINFSLPKWVEMLPSSHPVKAGIVMALKEMIKGYHCMRDIPKEKMDLGCEYVKKVSIEEQRRSEGVINCSIRMQDKYYYEMLSDTLGTHVEDEYDFMKVLYQLAQAQKECSTLGKAWEELKQSGYGVVEPGLDEITISEPELVKHGSKYGVKIKAIAPSTQLIRANVETEIAPIVGTEEQANDLIQYMKEQSEIGQEGIFETNIFGKTVRQLIEDGIQTKINNVNEASRVKLQDTMQKIINESNGGLICIII